MDPAQISFPYTAFTLTEQINRIPNLFGLIRAMGLFSSEGVTTTVVEIRREDGVIKVLPSKPRGAPGSQAERESGTTIFLEIPHFPHKDLITPKDLQDLLMVVGRTKTPKTMDTEIAKRLKNMRNNHDITLEYVRMGALKGLVKDGAGTTLHDLFSVFGITKKTVDFVLGTSSTDVIAKCEEVTDSVLSNLKGETSTGIEVIVSGSFFNKLVQHAKVEKYWVNTQNAQQLANMQRNRLGGNWGRVFEFQQILFIEYKGTAPIKSGGAISNEPFVAANYGHAYPVGTQDTFKTWNAPADDIRFANMPGQDIYVSPEVLDHGEGVELKSQSNPLAVCKRPETLVEISTSN